MKTHWSIIAATLGAITLCAWSGIAPAQVVVAETGSGVITDYTPGGQAILMREESSTAPTRYIVTKKTLFVDEAGSPMLAERVVSGMPITVHYMRDGDHLLASRIVVHKTASAPVTTTAPVIEERRAVAATTTAGGVITNFSPGTRMIVRSESAEPLAYAISGSTTYVDDAGTPIAVENISPGVPVTVHYVRDGDRLLASRVIVARPTTVVSPPTVIRETTTTTTTKSDEDDDDD